MRDGRRVYIRGEKVEDITKHPILGITVDTIAAAVDPVMYGEIAVTNPLICNMAKMHFASKYHEFIKLIQDIGGGILATAPGKKDWENPDIHDYL